MSVLPRRSRRGWPIPNAHRPKAADEDVTVDGVAVTNNVSRRYFPTIGIGELVRNPFSRWVRGHSQPWRDRLAYSVQREDFYHKTLRVFWLARAGLTYLSLGMHSEEQRRSRIRRPSTE
jgi:hypothetical protein